MKVFYTDKEGVTYELLDPRPTVLPRFVQALRGDTGKLVVVHHDGIHLKPDDSPKTKED